MTIGARLSTGLRGLITARSLPAWAFSALLTASVVVGRHVVFSGVIDAGIGANFMTRLSAADLLLSVLLTPTLALLLMLIADAIDGFDRKRESAGEESPRSPSVGLWIGVAAILLVAWSPYILTYAPGSVQPDSLFSLAGDRTNHHPILFTLVVSSLARLGASLGDINYGVFAYTLMQSLVMALALSFGVLRIARTGAPKWWTVAAIAYFGLVPVFPIYAINVQKDPLFSLFVAGLSLLLWGVAEGGGAALRTPRGVIAILAMSTLVLFFRNNGVFVILGSVAALLAFYRRGYRGFYVSVAVLLLVTLLIQGPGYDVLGIRRNTFVESIGIPLQQVAYVVATEGEISPEQREFLGQLLPYEEWPRAYAPCLVDPLKWHPQFSGAYLNTNRVLFFKTWGALLRQNPAAYFRAYCLASMGFWKIGVNSPYGFADTSVIANSMGVHPVDLFDLLTGTSVRPLLDGTRGSDGSGGYVGAGILIWTTLLSATLLVLRRRPEYVLALAPCVALWLSVMIATPVAFSLRYVFALAICLPGTLLLPFLGRASSPWPASTSPHQGGYLRSVGPDSNTGRPREGSPLVDAKDPELTGNEKSEHYIGRTGPPDEFANPAGVGGEVCDIEDVAQEAEPCDPAEAEDLVLEESKPGYGISGYEGEEVGGG